MKRAIITPTFKGHFTYIKEYLKSFDKYLINKDFPICFVIEKSENSDFQKIIKKYKKNLNIKIFYLEDIFKKYNIVESPKYILKTYGRLSFQTIKKFYGGLYSEAEEFFFLDSESMLIKPTDMNEVFETYFKHPNFFMSKVDDRHNGYKNLFVYNYILTVAKILNISPDYWTVESYEWFYKREILEDLINDLGQPIEIIKKVVPTGKFPDLEGVLEALLYYLYIYKNNNKYKYDIHIVQNEFSKYLGEEKYKIFRKNFDENKDLNIGGLYEYCTYHINVHNVNNFITMFQNNHIQVMRFKFPNNNYKYLKQVIENSNICILPSEQDHLFGINAKPLAIWSYEKGITNYYNRLIYHIEKLTPLNLSEIISTIYYLGLVIYKGLTSNKRYE